MHTHVQHVNNMYKYITSIHIIMYTMYRLIIIILYMYKQTVQVHMYTFTCTQVFMIMKIHENINDRYVTISCKTGN